MNTPEGRWSALVEPISAWKRELYPLSSEICHYFYLIWKQGC